MKAENEKFRSMFLDCQAAFSAIGDPTRQIIILYLIEHCGEGGKRVGDIQKNTNLSRTSVAHHLKILKDAQIITVRKEGTKNYYYIDPHSSSLKKVIAFWKETEKKKFK